MTPSGAHNMPVENTGPSPAAAERKTPTPLVERLPDAPPPTRQPTAGRAQPSPGRLDLNRPCATIEQEAEAEKYMRQAHLLKIRGDLKQSLAELVKAMEANPYDPTPQLQSAEILRNVGRPDDAIAVYERAIALMPEGPARGAAEAKLGRLVMEQQQLNSPEAFIGVSEASPLDNSGMSTVWASIIVPGLGQWISGQRGKSAIMMALWGIGIADASTVTNLLVARTATFVKIVVRLVPCCLVWLWALIDSLMASSRQGAKSEIAAGKLQWPPA